MDMALPAEYGIDYEKGLKNCMGNLAFYKRILSMFLQDHCFSRAKKALISRNYKEMFSCMHELMGVSGNAALMGLYQTTVPLVELLRGGTDADAEVQRLFAEMETAYNRTCEGIHQIINEP